VAADPHASGGILMMVSQNKARAFLNIRFRYNYLIQKMYYNDFGYYDELQKKEAFEEKKGCHQIASVHFSLSRL